MAGKASEPLLRITPLCDLSSSERHQAASSTAVDCRQCSASFSIAARCLRDECDRTYLTANKADQPCHKRARPTQRHRDVKLLQFCHRRDQGCYRYCHRCGDDIVWDRNKKSVLAQVCSATSRKGMATEVSHTKSFKNFVVWATSLQSTTESLCGEGIQSQSTVYLRGHPRSATRNMDKDSAQQRRDCQDYEDPCAHTPMRSK
jgi:hypothetical protein